MSNTASVRVSPDVIFSRNFINAETCGKMNEWVDEGIKNKWLDCGISRGSGWEYKKRITTRNYGHRFDYPTVTYEVFDKITAKLGLQTTQKSIVGGGKNGVVVSCTFPGGDVYAHTDPMEGTNLHVLRCNIMTRSADSGGELFIGGKPIDIGVGDLHCYLASDNEHYVQVVNGNTSRVLWMFGYSVTKELFDKLI